MKKPCKVQSSDHFLVFLLIQPETALLFPKIAQSCFLHNILKFLKNSEFPKRSVYYGGMKESFPYVVSESVNYYINFERSKKHSCVFLSEKTFV